MRVVNKSSISSLSVRPVILSGSRDFTIKMSNDSNLEMATIDNYFGAKTLLNEFQRRVDNSIKFNET